MDRQIEETVIQAKRVSKKTTGGNKISFTALVVVGDRDGRIGYCLSKAPSLSEAIRKAASKARDRMVKIDLVEGTVPHEAMLKMGAAKILIKPAPKGTGLVAGGAVRKVLELVGVRNVSAKILGTRNKTLNVMATVELLKSIRYLNLPQKTKIADAAK